MEKISMKKTSVGRGAIPGAVLLGLALTSVVAFGQHPAQASPENLAGLWGVELDFGPLVRGELTLDGRASPWRAQIAGFDLPADLKGATVSLTLPGVAGEFRGHVKPDQSSIVGQWIQPSTAVLFNRYATNVELAEVAPHVWRGQVVPTPARVSFYISIQRADDGSLSAFIRNPEFGWLQRGVFEVTIDGASVTFTNTKRRAQQLSGSYDAGAERLSLELIDGAPPLMLTRRDRQSALGFIPRTPRSAAYVYRQPVAEDDGWGTASLADVGLQSAPIATLIEKILAAEPGPAANPLNLQSLLIARHGKLVVEEYFYGFDAERPHDMRSASKTFAPVLVGLARDRGAQISPEAAAYELFPEYKPFAHWDARKARMKLKDLMSMTAGYDCDEDHSDTAPLNESLMQEQTAQPDWFKFTLDAPMDHDPGGESAYYCSAELNLVGGVAAKVSGAWLPEMFYEDFARPLEFRTYHLNLQPRGEAYMGGGAYLRPRDQLKLGQLYLAGGVWNGRRVISRDWVEQSLAVHASFEDRFGADHKYGWGWHIVHLKLDDRVYTEYAAGGNGGQLVVILPDLDMVVGFTGGAYGDFQSWGKWGVEVVPQFIIPAVRK